MIAIDTNVLIRLITKDDAVQAEQAYHLVQSTSPVLINHLVLCESIWVLSSFYELPKAKLCQVIESLLLNEAFLIPHNDLVWAALHDYQETKGDFSDILIGLSNQDLGAVTFSFDAKAVKQLPYFKMVP